MASGNHPAPDLATILRSLSESGQKTQSQSWDTSVRAQAKSATQGTQHDLTTLLSLLPPAQQHSKHVEHAPGQPYSQLISDRRDDVHRGHWNNLGATAPSQSRPLTSTTSKVGDASDITSWPGGLRHVNKLAAANDQFEPAIRKMIKNQNDNEVQWRTGRLTLIQQQKDRVKNKKELDDVLSSIGGNVNTAPEVHDNQAELRQYDQKVHRAMTTMTKAMTSELVALNVPFFKIEPELVVDSEAMAEEASSNAITKAKLADLQRQMLQYLLDLYGT